MSDFETTLRSVIPQILGFVPVVLDFSFVAASPDLRARFDGERLDISYVALDPLPPASFWGEASRGRLSEYDTIGERDSALASKERLALAVLPDGRVVPVGQAPKALEIYWSSPLTALAVADGRKSLEDACREAAEAVAGFRAWQAGEMCGVAIERFRVDRAGSTIELIDADAHWLHLDAKGALRHLDEVLDLRPSPAPAFI